MCDTFMITNFEDTESEDEDFLEMIEVVAFPRQLKIVRERPDHFTIWRDQEFFDRFRLSKETVRYVLSLIEQDRNNAVTPEQKILMALRYYATGSMLSVCGDFIGIHKSTASRIVREVSVQIALLRENFVYLPRTSTELEKVKQNFYNIAKFPRCVGALDCTHVKITSPGGPRAEQYRNRKGYFSMNVQIVCDADLKIQNIVARWPGGAHDSTIFNSSNVKARFERGELPNSLIVADSGYAVSKYILTPIQNPITEAEQLYNDSLIRTRNTVKRSFGVWKRRFPVLATGINVKISSAQSIIVATATLHNIAIDRKEETPRVTRLQEKTIRLSHFNNGTIVENRNRRLLHLQEQYATRCRLVGYFSLLL